MTNGNGQYNEHAFIPIQEVSMEEYRELQIRSRRFILHAVSEKSRVALHKMLARQVEPDRDQTQSAPFTIVSQGTIPPATNPEGWTHTILAAPDAVTDIGTLPELFITNDPVADDRGFVSYGVQDNGLVVDIGGFAVSSLFPPNLVTVEFLSGAGTRLDQWDLRPLWSYINSALGFQGISQKLFAYVHQDEMLIQHKYSGRNEGGLAVNENPYRMIVAEKTGKFLGTS